MDKGTLVGQALSEDSLMDDYSEYLERPRLMPSGSSNCPITPIIIDHMLGDAFATFFQQIEIKVLSSMLCCLQTNNANKNHNLNQNKVIDLT